MGTAIGFSLEVNACPLSTLSPTSTSNLPSRPICCCKGKISCLGKDNCFIGPFVEIQNDVIIGKNTRIQSHSFVCSNVTIGENCFIGHGVCFINDKFKNNKLERNKKNSYYEDNGRNN